MCVTHSADGREPRTLTVPQLPDLCADVRTLESADRTRLEAPGLSVGSKTKGNAVREFLQTSFLR